MTREEAITKLVAYAFWASEHVPDEVAQALDMAIEALKEQRPHGEWEFIGDNLFKCTHCGYVADGDYLRKWKVHTFNSEFPTACLRCGADMRKSGEAE